MKPNDVRAALKDIEANQYDAEFAHTLEDRLHQDVLREIAAGAENAAELAKVALQSRKIDFERWAA